MDALSTKVVIIAVSLFITVSIATALFAMFSQMKEIFGFVDETDTDIYSQFDNIYAMYDGRKDTGVGLLNVVKKYEYTDQNIVVEYFKRDNIESVAEANGQRPSQKLQELMEGNKKFQGELFSYENKYDVKVYEYNGDIIIRYELEGERK